MNSFAEINGFRINVILKYIYRFRSGCKLTIIRLKEEKLVKSKLLLQGGF
jgi:hypothetical protein